MSLAKITMTGMEMFLKNNDQSLFDLFVLPEEVDKNTCIDNILLECGEFETLYSDPYFMRATIGTWSQKHFRTFQKWITALDIEYNPLENYDRIEEWTDEGKEDSNTKSKTTTDSNGKSDQNGNTEDLVSAFDSDNYQESEKHVIDTDENHEEHIGSDSNIDNSANQSSEHHGRIHGNIGVTTSQQMLQSELDIARFNIINEITNLFMTELCICVYE